MSKSSANSGIERRRTHRRPILDTFSIFCVVPKKGPQRLPVHDVSDHGIGFDLEIEGEELQAFALRSGEQLELHFYLNQSLYIPASVRVVRIEERNAAGGPGHSKVRRIGAEFDLKDKGQLGIAAFLKMLDAIVDVAKIQGA